MKINDKELLALAIIFSFLGLIMLYYVANINYNINYLKGGEKESSAYFEDFSEVSKDFLGSEAKVKGRIAELKETRKGNFYGYLEDNHGKKLMFFVLTNDNEKNRECFKKGMEVEIHGMLKTFENEIEIFAESSKVMC